MRPPDDRFQKQRDAYARSVQTAKKWLIRVQQGIDLGTVDPLLMDEDGVVRPIRDYAGKPVSQVVLGGDSGVTLRDMLAAALLLKSKRVPSRLDLLVAQGDTFAFGDQEVRVIATPGHTSGHVSYFFPDGAALFCGDTLFALGCGRLFEGDAPTMWRSLGKLAALPDATRVYCGHEYTLSNARFALTIDPDLAALQQRAAEIEATRAAGRPTIPSTIGLEKATNPFLRAADPAPVEQLRLRAFDRLQIFRPRPQRLRVSIVDIDEASLQRYGQWPWPRHLLARLIGEIARQRPLVIGMDMIFPEPDRLSPEQVFKERPDLEALLEPLRPGLAKLPRNDALFAQRLAAAPVVLGVAGVLLEQPPPTTDLQTPPVLLQSEALALQLQGFDHFAADGA